MKNVVIPASSEYTVWIGKDILESAGGQIASVCGGETAMLVTDDEVNALYCGEVEASLRSAGYRTVRFVFPHGEQQKTLATYGALLGALTGARLTSSDVVVALGGGVVGDLAGFAAATYLRGLSFVQIPTTLLAMVDSSIGGKTAVNLPEGKNLAGTFWQPSVVLCDVEVLKTLSSEEFRDGIAEMIKYGVIASPALFALLKEPLTLLSPLEEVIEINVGIKRDFVIKDERDSGIRRQLGFGHTLGHAIEKLSDYEISHGKAVAAGMALTARGAARMGVCKESAALEITEMVDLYELRPPLHFSAAQLTEVALFDKKCRGKRITLILPERIGRCEALELGQEDFAQFVKLAVS